MILWFLSLFPQFRELERCIKIMDRCSTEIKGNTDIAIRMAGEDAAHWKARHESEVENVRFLREQLKKAEARIEATDREMKDLLITATDSLSLRATGRRLLSKTPIEAPPTGEQPHRAPLNLSRPFAGDVARQNTRDFLRRAAAQAGVIPQAEPADNKQPN